MLDLGQHLQLSLLALLLAVVIAIPVAVFSDPSKDFWIFITNCRDYSNITILSVNWIIYSVNGDWNIASFNNISVVCFIPNFANQLQDFKELMKVLLKQGFAFGMTKIVTS